MKLWCAVGAVLLSGAVSNPALAQRSDRTDRGDVSEFRNRQRPVSAPPARSNDLSVIITAERPAETIDSWSLDVQLPLLYVANPPEGPQDTRDAYLGNPSLALAYVTKLGEWKLTAKTATDADLFSRNTDDLDETRITGAISLSRKLMPGEVTFAFREKVAFERAGYSRFNYALERYVVGFSPALKDPRWSLSFEAEYRASAKAEQRRYFFSADAGWSQRVSSRWSLAVEEELDASSFRAGLNSGRRDLLSQTSFSVTPNMGLPPNVALSFGAFLFHRFSNRASARFTDFQIGPKLRIIL